MQYITTTFLRTKLYKPRPTHLLLPRPALVKRIEEGLATDLTMVVAPVGFGKTTLVAAWAEQTAQPVAWLTLDENDNNPVDFVAYLLAAIHTLFPGACPETQGLLRSGRVPETAVLSSLLINEIDDLPQRFILVLDDYHDIHAPAIHKLLDSILRHPPLQMHLLIASRSEPPLALARLRANVRLNELRSKDLRFTQDETANFLAQAFGAEIDAHATDLLARRAEGWIAGLQLAVLSLRTAQDQGTMLQNLERRVDRFIMDYLFEQVLQQQSPEVHAFLVKTSILDRISPDLALTLIDPGERPTGTLSLAELEHAGLFVNVLDDAGEWFSYHALFRELLRHHLQTRFRPEEVAALHRRASAWFRQNGLTDEALHHAMAAGDVDLAAQIITEQFPSWLVREEWRTLERWLEQMPPAAFEKHLWLLVAKTFVVQIQSQWELVVHLLERVEARLATPDSLTVTPESSVLRGYLDFLWSIHASININALQAKELAQRSMQCLPTEHMYVRGLAQTVLAMALQALGEIAVAEHMLTETLVFTPRVADGAYHRLRILMNLMSLRLADGRIEAAAQTARTLLQEALEFNAPSSQLWAHLALGVCAYQANDLALAAEHFAQGAELRHTGHIRGGHECLVSLALTFQMLGREDEVRSAVTRLADYDRQLTNAVLMAEGESLQLHLSTLAGKPIPAFRWSGTAAAPPALWFGWIEIRAITEVRAALTDASPALLDAARQSIDEMLELAVAIRKPGRTIELLSLKAVLHERRHERDAALQALAMAQAIGEPLGLVRSIADAGPQLEPLLLILVRRKPSAYLDRVLAALRPVSAISPPSASLVHAGQPQVHLTRREREVLRLLSQYMTDREIAETLVVSPLTVRTHIEHLSEKLQAHGRRAIVARAIELGLPG